MTAGAAGRARPGGGAKADQSELFDCVVGVAKRGVACLVGRGLVNTRGAGLGGRCGDTCEGFGDILGGLGTPGRGLGMFLGAWRHLGEVWGGLRGSWRYLAGVWGYLEGFRDIWGHFEGGVSGWVGGGDNDTLTHPSHPRPPPKKTQKILFKTFCRNYNFKKLKILLRKPRTGGGRGQRDIEDVTLGEGGGDIL